MIGSALGLALGLMLGSPPGATSDYAHHQIIAVPAGDAQALALLRQAGDPMQDGPQGAGLEDPVWVAAASPTTIAMLDASGHAYRVVGRDLGRQLEEERIRLRQPTSPFGAWFDDFKDLEAIDAYLDDLAALAPDAAVTVIGQSAEGRDIRAISLGRDSAPSVVVIGTQHAREWASPMVTMCLVDALIRDRERDPLVAQIAEGLRVVVVPVANPDGYVYTWSDDRMWRKNRNGSGVDLNRNWDVQWGLGTEGQPSSSEIYPGTGPFSEPETTALRDLILDEDRLAAVVDYHSPVNLVLYPFAFPADPDPRDGERQMIAEAMASAITDVHGLTHTARQPGQGNPSGGLAQDWAASNLGTLAWTVEVRGQSTGSSGGFVIPPSEIVPACEENLAGFLEMAQALAEEDPGGTSGGSGSTGGSTGSGSAGTTTGEGSGSGGESTQGSATGGADSTSGAGSSGQGGSEGGDSGMSDGGPGGDQSGPGNDAGCGCRGTAPGGPGWLALVVLGFRRRRPARQWSPSNDPRADAG